MPRLLTALVLLASMVSNWCTSAAAKSPLTADKMTVALRPELPGDRDYLTYVDALLQQGRLPRDLVESTFLWAREKAQYKYRYFRRALILRADQVGIDLPENNPPPYGTIEGVVAYHTKIGLITINVPAKRVSVRIVGTDFKTTTNDHGEFSFAKVPFGVYRVYARGKVMLAKRQGSVKVALPTKPPSTKPARAFIAVK